jgi:hypothetical protein
MDTALIIRYGAEDAILEKQRTVDDTGAIWGIVELWLLEVTTVSVRVERYDSTDTEVSCFVATPEAIV